MNGRLRAVGIVLSVQRLDVIPEDPIQDLEDPLDVFLVGVVKIRGHKGQLLVGKQGTAEIQNEDLLLILPEQLVLDVISRKNTTYLPNIVNFANLKKKMECAAYVGITSEEEYDEYLTNHYKFTYTTDDAVSNGMDDTEKVELALASGRAHAIDNGHYVDPWGLEFDPNATSYFNYGHPLIDIEDNPSILDAFHAPVLDDMDLQFKYAEEDLKKYSGKMLCVLSGYNGIWEKTYDMMEIQNFMITLMEEPEIIERLFHIVTDYKVEIAREAVKRGFKLGHHGDDLGTQTSTFFSEEQFVTFLKPRLKEIFSVWRDAGLPMQMHSCGFITPLIPHLIDIGLTVLEPCQPCMDLAFLKREYGKDLVFYGGIDTQKLLAFDPPGKVYEETLRTIDIMGKDGGYIVGPAQEIMDNVSPANVDAMVRAIRHYRGDD